MPQSPFNICHETEAPTSARDREAYTSHTPAWALGKEGATRPVTPGADSGILALLVGVMVLLGLNMGHVRRVFRTLPQDLLSVRRRTNLFDEHTGNEWRVIILLILVTCVMEGLLLFMWLDADHPQSTSGMLRAVGAFTCLGGAYYLFQLAACATVGYVFTDPVSAGLWRRGLNASQVMLGLALTIPTLVALFYPETTGKMLIVAAGLYLLSRICYISKGFRIFYINFPSLLYFILYLCTLEIIPPVILCITASEICVKVQ
ncbi:MAG: DUF4271 domain-containing protein [Muribaculaceae bacterium]|nr:DUF4271 domain-containing protein [Muribaculaceae bacterium]